jgi:hypothetical protein
MKVLNIQSPVKNVCFALTLILAAGALSGCAGPIWRSSTANAAAQKMPAHESWCYSTLGYTECYPHPLAETPGRLVNVDPPSRYPLTPEAYNKAVAQSR